MTYYLFKSEPTAYSFDEFVRDGETAWDRAIAFGIQLNHGWYFQ